MSAGADPFADAAPGGAVTDDPFAEVDAIEPDAPATDDLPIVDREGQPAAPAAPDAADPAAPQAPVVEVSETGGETPVAPQQPQPSAADTGELATPADHMAGQEQPPAQPAPAPPAAPEPPAEAPQPPQEPQTAPPAAPEPPAAPPAAPEPQAAAPAAPPADPPAGDPPAESAKPKGEMRHYKALYQTGPKVWTEFPLTGDIPEGVKVVTVDGELYFEARNNDHATRIAYHLLGQPEAGVTVWPVPKGAFKPKRVKPAAPKPERTRLEIS